MLPDFIKSKIMRGISVWKYTDHVKGKHLASKLYPGNPEFIIVTKASSNDFIQYHYWDIKKIEREHNLFFQPLTYCVIGVYLEK